MKNSIEVWKDVPGYEGLYQASTFGRARSLDVFVNVCGGGKRLKKGRILKLTKNNMGYYYFTLSKNSERKHKLVHRLVAEMFIPNPHNLPCVNHKDENPANNAASNLEWCTQRYNCNYGSHNTKIAVKHKRPILQLTKEGELVCEWSSAFDVQKALGYSNSAINSCCHGKRNYKSAYGYIWKFKES